MKKARVEATEATYKAMSNFSVKCNCLDYEA